MNISFPKFEDFFFIVENDGPAIRNMDTSSYNWKTKVKKLITTTTFPPITINKNTVSYFDTDHLFVTRSNSLQVLKLDNTGDFSEVRLPAGLEYLAWPYAVDKNNSRLFTYKNTNKELSIEEINYEQSSMIHTRTYKFPPLTNSKNIQKIFFENNTLYFYKKFDGGQIDFERRNLLSEN